MPMRAFDASWHAQMTTLPQIQIFEGIRRMTNARIREALEECVLLQRQCHSYLGSVYHPGVEPIFTAKALSPLVVQQVYYLKTQLHDHVKTHENNLDTDVIMQHLEDLNLIERCLMSLVKREDRETGR